MNYPSPAGGRVLLLQRLSLRRDGRVLGHRHTLDDRVLRGSSLSVTADGSCQDITVTGDYKAGVSTRVVVVISIDQC